MIPNDHSGLFVAMEGLDGSGSIVQAQLLASVLEKEGYRVFLTKEPTNNLMGGLIRAQLSGEWKAGPETLQLLFTADRAKHLEQEIIPALEAGKVVITDRYALSSIAYGSVELSDRSWLEDLNRRFILPDVTFLIKVRPKICAMRMKASHYAVELYSEEKKLTQVWKVYEELSKDKGYANIEIINGERPEVEIVHELREKIIKALASTEDKS